MSYSDVDEYGGELQILVMFNFRISIFFVASSVFEILGLEVDNAARTAKFPRILNFCFKDLLTLSF
jgi:hypothetical protein